MQTSKEIVDGILRKKPVERMGFFDSPWGDTLEKWAAEEGYPKNEEGKPVSPTDHFGFDLAGGGGWFDIMPLRGVREVVEETDEWQTTRNGAGASFKYWKHKSGTPEHVDFRMKSREIWDRDYRPHLLEVDRARLDVEATKKELERRKGEKKWTFYGHQFIFENMRSSMGDLCMYESLVTDPGWVHDFNRVYTDFYKTYFKILFEEAGLPHGVWLYEDLGYNKGLICSPATLESLIFPYYREMIDFLHGYDLPVVLHSCGGIVQAMPLIVDVGFDALNPMEAKAGCDVVRLMEQYGDRLAFIGGLDARIIESGDRKRIRDEVLRITGAARATGTGYVFGSDHSLSTNVRLADFQYAVEVYKENRAY